MKEIKELVEHIREEIEDSEDYIKQAMKYKDTDKSLAETYATLSKQELTHQEMLHSQAVRLIEAQKKSGFAAPVAMQAVWDWEHEKIIDKVSKIKHMHEMYRA